MKYVLFLLLTFYMQASFGQDSIYVKLVGKEKLIADRFVGIDNLQNSYYIKSQTLYKEGQQENYQFKTLGLGEITSVDVINPLKILVFFKETNSIILLDNKLNEITRINFNHITNFKTVSYAATAINPKLWIYNTDNTQLELIDYKNLSNTIAPLPIKDEVIGLTGNYNYCWLLSPKKIIKYDRYGKMLATTPHNGFEKIHNNNNKLIAKKEEKLYIQEIANARFIPINGLENTCKDFYFTHENLYIYDGNFLYTYQLTPN